MRILKLYYTPCPVAREFLRAGRHLGFKVKGDRVSHLFKIEGDIRPRKSLEEGISRVNYNSSSRCVVFESRACIIRDLLERFHVISIRIHKDCIVAVVVASGGNSKIPKPPGSGPCLLKVEELRPEDVMFIGDEAAVARKLIEEGYFSYPRGVSLSELSKRLGVPKSRLSYVIRRIAKKALNVTA